MAAVIERPEAEAITRSASTAANTVVVTELICSGAAENLAGVRHQ